MSLCMCMAEDEDSQTEEADSHPAISALSAREAEDDQLSGLPWADLEALFGQDVQALGLEIVDGESDGDSHPAMKWSEDNIEK